VLSLHINQAAEDIVVTLNELVTISNPYYLFVFKHVTEKTIVSIIKNSADDESLFQYRYNQFELATSTLFANKPIGQWLYEVYQQSSSSNTDPELAEGLVENGKMNLYPATDFEYETYNEQSTYKAYNG
jgi:hypothetical protein